MQLTGSGHTFHAIRALIDLGWKIAAVPSNGRLQRNGQTLRLHWGKKEAAFRLFIYKITGSGRSQHERRVEITTTYQKGLRRMPGYEDIVLGYAPDREVFVGVDARRIEHGGKTGNASSFIDPEGLTQATDRRLTILRRSSQLLGIERHAYFKAARLAEYLVNAREIHRGSYTGSGDFSRNQPVNPRPILDIPRNLCGGRDVALTGPTNVRERKAITRGALAAVEEGNDKRLHRLKLTQSELMQLNFRLQQIGLRGEEIILKAEISRLRRAGRADLAAKVSWVSQTSPFEGYDILSFETTGAERFIEVKSTAGRRKCFPMTENEWAVASQKGASYLICRVSDVETQPKTIHFRNPTALVATGKLRRSPLVWMVSYQ